MATTLVGEDLKLIDRLHGGYFNHWVGGIMHRTVQNRCGLQYSTMRLSGYISASTEPNLLALKHGM